MSPARLTGLGLAVPPHVVDQDVAAQAAAVHFEGKVFRTPDLLAVFKNTGINTRHVVLPMAWYNPAPRLGRAQRRLSGSRRDPLCRGRREGPRGRRAEGRRHRHRRDGLSTGIATPSLEARLHGRLGFAAGVKRVPVFGLGCAGGCRGSPSRRGWRRRTRPSRSSW